MKSILIFMILITSTLFAVDSNTSKEDRIQKQLKIEMQKEQKYAKEQIFYQHWNYDYKGAEVNKESLKKLPEIELDDLDMDSVYD